MVRAVVGCPPGRITEQIVGVGQFPEPGRCPWVGRPGVGMRAMDGPPVGAGDVLPGCADVHAEHPVGIVVASPGCGLLHAAPPFTCTCLLFSLYLLLPDESRKLEPVLVKRRHWVLYR